MLRRQWALAALLTSVTAAVQAADLQVRVVERDTRVPLVGIAVCLGTAADPAQFGAKRSGAEGVVQYRDLPDAPLVLTVSGDGYRGYRSSHTLGEFDLTVEVPLPSGGLGPECRGAPLALETQVELREGDRSLVIEEVQVARDADKPEALSLRLSARGEPSHYRLATRADFAGSEWQAFEPLIEYQLSDSDVVTLYLQVRRLRGVEGGEVESLSAVARIAVRR